MKKSYSLTVLLAAFVTVFNTVASPHSLAEESASAQLTKKSNQVECLQKDQTLWKEAQLQQVFLSGDTLRTGKESSAQLAFSDGSLIRMASLSRIYINPVQREVKFSLGKILLKFFRKEPEAKVITPSAVAATLGTAWVEEIGQNGEVTLHVVEGAVNFTSGGASQTVKAGEWVTALLNQPPSAPQPFDVPQYVKTEPLFEGLEDLFSQPKPTNPAVEIGQTSPPVQPVVPPVAAGGGMGPTGQPLPPQLPPWFP